jgi:hypothetical protein
MLDFLFKYWWLWLSLWVFVAVLAVAFVAGGSVPYAWRRKYYDEGENL